ncbi:MAG: hypothetical protein Q8S33_10785 [Myxococcales bacterium]|nr:hypothetical protein [Myxococcales bacterium]
MLTGTPDSVTHATARPFDPARLLRMVVQVGRLVVQRHAGSAT